MVAHNCTTTVVSRALPLRTQILFVVNFWSLDVQEIQTGNEKYDTSGNILCEILQELLFFRGQLRLSLI